MKKQKLIRVYEEDTKEFDALLVEGWLASSISATTYCVGNVYCYVLMEREEEVNEDEPC